ncbi:hypothetical protein EAI_04857 [Harpegnathos saltator]|uniref:Uncharacterized protein n=1 Tax=Harpegnathos saltator TaxID=610380 RepID=E2BXL9_HARSA|nr:hypothetical protein EAI_04857 [Harpegnathos saltator]
MSGKEKQHYPDDVLELKKLLEEASQRREKAIQKEQDLRKRKEEVVKQQLRNAIEKTIREAEQIEKQNKKMKKQIRQANSDDSIDIVEVDEQSPTHFDPNQPSTSGVSKKDKPISRYSYERGFSERMQRPYINLNTIPRPRNKRGQYRPWTQGELEVYRQTRRQFKQYIPNYRTSDSEEEDDNPQYRPVAEIGYVKPRPKNKKYSPQNKPTIISEEILYTPDQNIRIKPKGASTPKEQSDPQLDETLQIEEEQQSESSDSYQPQADSQDIRALAEIIMSQLTPQKPRQATDTTEANITGTSSKSAGAKVEPTKANTSPEQAEYDST